MSDIGNPITAIENEAWVEAVARAICRSDGPSPDGLRPDGSPMWTFYQVDAIAAIRAVAPLIIERCAEVADHFRGRPVGAGDGDTYVPSSVHGPHVAAAIRALIQKEA